MYRPTSASDRYDDFCGKRSGRHGSVRLHILFPCLNRRGQVPHLKAIPTLQAADLLPGAERIAEGADPRRPYRLQPRSRD
jgi:hypothetical protein